MICGNETDLSFMKSVLLKKGGKSGFAHIRCATAEELKNCILEIARSEKEYYDDLMKITHDFDADKIKQFENKHGSFEEIIDYTPSDSQLIISALLHELQNKQKESH